MSCVIRTALNTRSDAYLQVHIFLQTRNGETDIYASCMGLVQSQLECKTQERLLICAFFPLYMRPSDRGEVLWVSEPGEAGASRERASRDVLSISRFAFCDESRFLPRYTSRRVMQIQLIVPRPWCRHPCPLAHTCLSLRSTLRAQWKKKTIDRA